MFELIKCGNNDDVCGNRKILKMIKYPLKLFNIHVNVNHTLFDLVAIFKRYRERLKPQKKISDTNTKTATFNRLVKYGINVAKL